MRHQKAFTLIEILVALGLLAVLALGTFVFQNTRAAHFQKLKQKQSILQSLQNTMEQLRATPFLQIQSSLEQGVVVNEIKPGLKEITVSSGNLQLYTRRFDNPQRR
jgi:prepilin-type N-terminal cleavage/methylation domain-containing protein